LRNITIIGCGAIGTLWANYLSDCGYQVTLVGRRDNHQPMPLLTADGLILNQSIPYLSNQLPPSNDLVIVTTKSYQVNAAISPYLDTLRHCPIVLMHNGLGAADQLSLHSSHQIYLATTSQAALIKENQCIHTGIGNTIVGGFNRHNVAQAKTISHLLNQVLAPVDYVENITQALWTKLAINCAINPLTALHHCNNGALSQQPYRQQIDRIIEEISLLTTALNLDLSYQTLRDNVDMVIEKTANNFSSMHQDVTFGRATEIDFINGYVVKQGASLAIPTPINNQLLQAIHQRELTYPAS